MLIAPSLVSLQPHFSRRAVVCDPRSNTVLTVLDSWTLGLPEWDSGAEIAGIPLRIDTPSSLIVGSSLDATIGLSGPLRDGVVEVPMGVRAPAWSVLRERVDLVELRKTMQLRVIETAVGWPMRSVVGRVRLTLQYPDASSPSSSWGHPEYDWAVAAPARTRFRHGVAQPPQKYPIFPLRPIMLGSVVNSALYGGVLYLGFVIAGRVLLLLRRITHNLSVSPGHCRACGYAAGNLGRCPECGSRRIRPPQDRTTAPPA